jgi:predicted site-specific integrase-resolvase
MSSAPEALTLDEFCKRVKIGRTKAYEEVRAGRLVVRKNGKKSIVTAEDGQRYLDNLPRLELPSK